MALPAKNNNIQNNITYHRQRKCNLRNRKSKYNGLNISICKLKFTVGCLENTIANNTPPTTPYKSTTQYSSHRAVFFNNNISARHNDRMAQKKSIAIVLGDRGQPTALSG